MTDDGMMATSRSSTFVEVDGQEITSRHRKNKNYITVPTRLYRVERGRGEGTLFKPHKRFSFTFFFIHLPSRTFVNLHSF